MKKKNLLISSIIVTFQTAFGQEKCRLVLTLFVGDKLETQKAARKKSTNLAKVENPCYTCKVKGFDLDSFHQQ